VTTLILSEYFPYRSYNLLLISFMNTFIRQRSSKTERNTDYPIYSR